MANTEGMADEVVASLFSTATEENRSSERMLGGKKQSTFLQRRMETPMGERPAATVTRKSARGKVAITPKKKTAPSLKRPKQESNEFVPLVGSIVERPMGVIKPRDGNDGIQPLPKSQSRFAASRFKNNRLVSLQSGGFPSVADYPVGTFTRKKTGEAKNRSAMTKKSTVQGVASSSRQDTVETSGQGGADALLAQMSMSEIQESVQELESALSPETIAFLRKRGQQKRHAKETEPMKASNQEGMGSRKEVVLDDAANAARTSRRVQNGSSKDTNGSDAQEKERLAKVLSSIRTYDDLDAAYENEFGISPTKQSGESPSNDGSNGGSISSDLKEAFKLLRSTAPRQTLWAARVVSDSLKNEFWANHKRYRIGTRFENGWPFPVLLPVALRCLLDANVTHSNGYELHTYVLRSLYFLLMLRSPEAHVVNVTPEGRNDSPQHVYQVFFMEDAVPTPPFGSCYPVVSAVPLATNKKGDAMVYSTSSSSTSAKQDGEAFKRDPMWTLLTKMKIIPRLAQLLSSTSKIPREDRAGVWTLPEEALVAICGMLAMLSLRSPGAASAIAMHPTLLAALLEASTLMPPTESTAVNYMNATVALPALILLNVMARQSRVVAAAIPFATFGPSILALEANSDGKQIIQKWTLILWRKLLRYGIGLSHLSSMVSMSIRPIAAAAADSHNRLAFHAPEYISSFAIVLECGRVMKGKGANSKCLQSLSETDKYQLSGAIDWLSSVARQCASCLKETSSADNSVVRLQASSLGLINAYFQAEDEAGRKLMEETTLLSNLRELLCSRQVEMTLGAIPCYGDDSKSNDTDTVAIACGFVHSLSELMSVWLVMFSDDHGAERQDESATNLVLVARSALLQWLETRSETISGRTEPYEPSQPWWVVHCHFSICKFLMMPQFSGLTDLATHGLIRSFALQVVGQLDHGDEAKAAILLGNDNLFRCAAPSRTESSSALSSMFMRELCLTDVARKQLDHSFKLNHGFGIKQDECGHFALDSLLSDADTPRDKTNPKLLPLGNTWLWNVLSGTLRGSSDTRHDATETFNDMVTVLGECLALLLDLVEHNGQGDKFYSKCVPHGAKIYFLMNLCLYPEVVLQHPVITPLALHVFERLSASLEGDTYASQFMAACFKHSQITKTVVAEKSVMDRVLAAPTEEIRAVDDFVADLCNGFLAFGAQYELFVRCMRFLLRPAFPPKIRCEVLDRLRHVMPLLTLPCEDDGDTLQKLVRDVLSPTRDSAQVLDLVADIAKKSPRSEGPFFNLLAVSLLARDVLGRRRLTIRLRNCPMTAVILATASALFEMDEPDTSDLVLAAYQQLNTTQQQPPQDLTQWMAKHKP